jgi:pimeloyl-ACP methyl ester carboxylesterase
MDAPALRFVTTEDGYSVAYTVCGEGSPLVYLPSMYSHTHLFWRSPNVFRLLYERLAASFRLICYDSRGLGSSQRALPPNFRIEDYETDLNAVVSKLGLERFTLLAQSGAARTAVSYAAQHPERVRALILWNPDIGVPVDQYPAGSLQSLAQTNWDLYIEFIVRATWEPEDVAVGVELVRESITQSDWLIRARAWSNYSAVGWLKSVQAPTLLLASARKSTAWDREEAARFVASQIPVARLELFNDSRAGLFSREPGEPAGVQLIREFMAGLESDSDGDYTSRTPRPAARLSARETEVLRLIATGKSNQEIADVLVLSRRTVERHISNLYAKIGVHRRAEATAYALRHGIE